MRLEKCVLIIFLNISPEGPSALVTMFTLTLDTLAKLFSDCIKLRSHILWNASDRVKSTTFQFKYKIKKKVWWSLDYDELFPQNLSFASYRNMRGTFFSVIQFSGNYGFYQFFIHICFFFLPSFRVPIGGL
jgi:hypothetical protein